jgi:hypothetical protein
MANGPAESGALPTRSARTAHRPGAGARRTNAPTLSESRPTTRRPAASTSATTAFGTGTPSGPRTIVPTISWAPARAGATAAPEITALTTPPTIAADRHSADRVRRAVRAIRLVDAGPPGMPRGRRAPRPSTSASATSAATPNAEAPTGAGCGSARCKPCGRVT